jgi:mRNA interferase RelE/StbE
MTVLLEKQASLYLYRLNEPDYSRVLNALQNLADDPPSGDIKKLHGKDGFRARAGDYRILFDVTDTNVIVYKIGPRGQVYREN